MSDSYTNLSGESVETSFGELGRRAEETIFSLGKGDKPIFVFDTFAARATSRFLVNSEDFTQATKTILAHRALIKHIFQKKKRSNKTS